MMSSRYYVKNTLYCSGMAQEYDNIYTYMFYRVEAQTCSVQVNTTYIVRYLFTFINAVWEATYQLFNHVENKSDDKIRSKK